MRDEDARTVVVLAAERGEGREGNAEFLCISAVMAFQGISRIDSHAAEQSQHSTLPTLTRRSELRMDGVESWKRTAMFL